MKKRFFFGNYFYGLCVVALTIEAVLQQQISFPPIIYFFVVFSATVVFYTKAYIAETIGSMANERSVWYVQNRKSIFNSQVLLTVLLTVFSLLLLPNIGPGIKNLPIGNIILLLSFPLAGFLYYGFSSKFSLRNTHWLKPFIIGFVWGGIVTWGPLFYNQLQVKQPLQISLINGLLFLKNLMFVAVLCMMFDIKDYATDYNHHLKTFVVSFGLRKTIFYIIIPLALLGFASFLMVAHVRHFSLMKILLNSIPFILLLAVAYSLHHRRSILYYLMIIDGLLLVKAVCGSIAMFWF